MAGKINLKRIIISLLALIFTIGIASRIYWTRGGPEWAYQYGDLMILFVYLVIGLLVTFRAVFLFINAMKLYSLRKDKSILVIIKKQAMLIIIGLFAVAVVLLVSILRFR